MPITAMTSDLRYAARQLTRAPGFTFIVVLTLALCVGANLGVAQLLYGALFAPLPISHPHELYSLEAAKSPFDAKTFLSYSAYRNLRRATQDTSPVIARSGNSRTVFQRANTSAASSSLRIDTQLVSDNFFSVLGLSPATGRFFLDGDDESRPAEIPAVLRYAFWKQELAADPAAIGARIILNGVPAVIVGVAPEKFSGVVAGEAPDLWLPLSAQSSGQFQSWFDSLGPGHGVNLEAPLEQAARNLLALDSRSRSRHAEISVRCPAGPKSCNPTSRSSPRSPKIRSSANKSSARASSSRPPPP